MERKHKLIQKVSKHLPDLRNHRNSTHTIEDPLKQRVYIIILAHEDANDVTHLQYDPLFKEVPLGDLASQPTISIFENSLDKQSIFDLCNAWVDNYVLRPFGRQRLVIDVDATDT